MLEHDNPDDPAAPAAHVPNVSEAEERRASHLIDPLERMKALAEMHLSDYALDDAIDALCDVDNTTPHEIPDAILVKSARLHLDTQYDPDGGDPGAALRAAEIDAEWEGGLS